MREFISLCVIIIVISVVIIFYQIKYNSKEHFKSGDLNKLLIKKTQNFKKIFNNNNYSIWEPLPINDYYPLGHYISFNKKQPNKMAILVKNKLGSNKKDKPFRYEINTITNKDYAIWNIIPNKEYISLGVVYSESYPSKYLFRCIPKHFCIKSFVNNKLIENKVKKNDRGYELWQIDSSNLFICNNLNNTNNINNLKNVYKLNQNYLDIERKLYVKNTNKYKKLVNYYDSKLNKLFYIWRPIPSKNFCSLGDIILNYKDNPNDVLSTITAHNSLCKIPLNYGNKSILKIETNNKKYNINFWRPVPHNNYYFFGDIVVMGEEEPDADNLIYSISIDYLSYVNYDTHNIVYNNIDNKNPLSIWSDEHNFFMATNGYKNVDKNNILLNKNFIYSDYDMMDLSRKIIFKFKTNKKHINKIDENILVDIIKKNLSSKLDINITRLHNLRLDLDKKEILLHIKSRNVNTDEISIDDLIKKIRNTIMNEDIKIYDTKKQYYYISIDEIYSHKNNKEIIIDNSLFNEKIKDNQ